MRVLVACERSGVVRDAFVKYGHDAWSCDIEPQDNNPYEPWTRHYHCDVREVIGPEWKWDLMIAHPPCTYLSNMSNCRIKEPGRLALRVKAMHFFMWLASANIPRIAIENPRGFPERHWQRADQIIHPYEFGHPESKATCLWLKNLPPLLATSIVDKNRLWDGKRYRTFVDKVSNWRGDAAKVRSVTFQGIADAMAEQWGSL